MDFPAYQYHSFNGLVINKASQPVRKPIDSPLKAKIEPTVKEIKKVDISKPVSPFQCKECEFVGKNDKSLLMHFRRSHAKQNSKKVCNLGAKDC